MGRYINSVPLLTAEHRVSGFVWEVTNFSRDNDGIPLLPTGIEYIGGTPGNVILVATRTPQIHLPPPLQAHAWKMQTHNDPAAAAKIPFATLGPGHRYAHLESFSIRLDTPDDLPDLQWCTFLCGATSGEEHVCDD